MNLINTYPYTISNSGSYKLNASLDGWNVSGPLITIAADDVLLDGSGAWLIDSYGVSKQGVGVYGLNRSRVVVRNMCIFGPGLRYAIHFENNDSLASQGRNIVENCGRLGANFRAVRMEANNSIVRNNNVMNCGGASWVSPVYAFGIDINGPNSIVEGNIIEEVYGSTVDGESVGISISSNGAGSIIKDNIIRNANKVTASMGIWVGEHNSEDVKIYNNVFENYKRCLFGSAQAGIAEGNFQTNCGPLSGESAHDLYDIPGTDNWTGNNMGT